MLSCYDLKCNHLPTPIGVDETPLTFEWKLKSDEKNVTQSAYRLVIDGLMDTGKVETDQSIGVSFPELSLAPYTRYDYHLTVWDNHGEESEPAHSFFETGLLTPDNWIADWITTREGNVPECPVFRKQFPIRKEVKSARIYATGLGFYEMELNGERVGDIWFAPGYTSYNLHLRYQAYDVTEQLKKDNCLSYTLAKGWCRCRRIHGVVNRFKCEPGMLLQLRIEYSDGEVEFIKSDKSWEYTESRFRFSEVYDGETYDASYELTNWRNAVLLSYPKQHIQGDQLEPVRITQELKPIAIFRTPKNELLVDFGQNIAGFAQLKVSGKKGDRVVYNHTEVLDKDGNFYNEYFRTAKTRVEYILSGEGEEVFHPHFYWQGFRYIKVEEFPGEVTPESFTALVVHTDMERTGHFECANEKVNQLYRNAIWSQRANFIGNFTDCPTRDERHGWLGDLAVFLPAAIGNMDVKNMISKMLQDCSLEQLENGSAPILTPGPFIGGYGSAVFSDFVVTAPWDLYQYYGDKAILSKMYEPMKKFVDFVRSEGDNEYLWNTGVQYGDWLADDKQETDVRKGSYKGKTSVDFVATVYFYHSADLLSQIAQVLDKSEDATHYRELADRILEAFYEEFVSPSGRIDCNTQTAYTAVLNFGMAKDKKKVTDRLAQLIHDNNDQMTTGFCFANPIMHVLSENGQNELAYTLLLQECPFSWLYSVTLGATTLWEHLNAILPDGSFQGKAMNSLNYCTFGSVIHWMYAKMAGLQPAAPGYREILIKPYPDSRIPSAKASLNTPYGIVSSSWKMEENTFRLDVEIPPNTTATVVLPSGTETKLGSGSYHLEESV